MKVPDLDLSFVDHGKKVTFFDLEHCLKMYVDLLLCGKLTLNSSATFSWKNYPINHQSNK